MRLMKKSELRQIIREEIQALNEKSGKDFEHYSEIVFKGMTNLNAYLLSIAKNKKLHNRLNKITEK